MKKQNQPHDLSVNPTQTTHTVMPAWKLFAPFAAAAACLGIIVAAFFLLPGSNNYNPLDSGYNPAEDDPAYTAPADPAEETYISYREIREPSEPATSPPLDDTAGIQPEITVTGAAAHPPAIPVTGAETAIPAITDIPVAVTLPLTYSGTSEETATSPPVIAPQLPPAAGKNYVVLQHFTIGFFDSANPNILEFRAPAGGIGAFNNQPIFGWGFTDFYLNLPGGVNSLARPRSASDVFDVVSVPGGNEVFAMVFPEIIHENETVFFFDIGTSRGSFTLEGEFTLDLNGFMTEHPLNVITVSNLFS
jgi:hypothetical protein